MLKLSTQKTSWSDHDSSVWCNNLRSVLNSLLIYIVILQLLFISPMPPWTNPNMVCMATIWIPYTLCVKSALIQFHRSLTFARFTGVINLVFPKWARILLLVQQLYWHQARIFQDVSPSQGAHLKSIVRENWNRMLGIT